MGLTIMLSILGVWYTPFKLEKTVSTFHSSYFHLSIIFRNFQLTVPNNRESKERFTQQYVKNQLMEIAQQCTLPEVWRMI